MWDLIVSVPDHCLSFSFYLIWLESTFLFVYETTISLSGSRSGTSFFGNGITFPTCRKEKQARGWCLLFRHLCL